MKKIDEIIHLMSKTYGENKLIKDALRKVKDYSLKSPSKKDMMDFLEKMRPSKLGGDFIYLNKMISYIKQEINKVDPPQSLYV